MENVYRFYVKRGNKIFILKCCENHLLDRAKCANIRISFFLDVYYHISYAIKSLLCCVNFGIIFTQGKCLFKHEDMYFRTILSVCSLISDHGIG